MCACDFDGQRRQRQRSGRKGRGFEAARDSKSCPHGDISSSRPKPANKSAGQCTIRWNAPLPPQPGRAHSSSGPIFGSSPHLDHLIHLIATFCLQNLLHSLFLGSNKAMCLYHWAKVFETFGTLALANH